MSVHVTGPTWRHSKAKGSDLLVQLALADQANDDGWCWPGQGTISQRTRLSRATVQRALCRLAGSCPSCPSCGVEHLGEIEIHHRDGTSSLYRVTLGGAAEVAVPPDGVPQIEAPSLVEVPVGVPQDEAGVPHSCEAGGCLTHEAGGASLVMHKTSLNRQIEPSRTVTAPPAGGCDVPGCDKPLRHSGQHRNPWWDMIVEVLGYRDGHVPPRQTTRVGRLARYVQGRGDPPEMIRKAARGIIVAWGREKLTINSLEEHYELFTGALSDIDEGDVAAVKGALREDRARRDILAAAGRGA